MKVGTVIALSVMGSAPFLGIAGVDWLKNSDVKRVLAGGDVSKVADDIAKREFSTNVTLALLDDSTPDTVTGELGDTLRPSHGNEYRVLDVRFTNEGRLDVSAFAYQFSATDASGRTHHAMLGLDHPLEATRLRTGEAAEGALTFELPKGTQLEDLDWQAEFASATFPLDATG